ncbi:MAG: hypothetical protein IKH01_12575 [Prevotella sp.]|nr:hypothetical protein [Prevotella sp.]MBR3080625.1 hypothetical protein [Prevotella sp.]
MLKGKALFINRDALLVSRGYWLKDKQNKYKVVDKYALSSRFALTRRLLRAEITSFYHLENGDKIAVAKKGLFLCKKGNNTFEKCFPTPRGSKPLNLCLAQSGNIYFGEYFQNMGKQAVNIYGSEDNGETWHVVYSFLEGNINHIHGLFFDKHTNRIWVATGDRENECIIGYTEDEFKTFVEVFRGGQEYRTCQLFFYKDFIVFGTDTQYEQNVLKKLDRQTLEITELQKVQGSVIKGGQVGDVAFISTTVEPSEVNTDKWAHLWVTKDGVHWEERYKAKKDWLPATLFQFGTFEFPQYYGVEKLDRLYFSGRALKGLDGKTTFITL